MTEISIWVSHKTEPSLPNTIKEEDFSAIQEYSIKCPQCQKGCQTFQALKEHIEVSHSELSSLSSSDADSLCIPNTISSTPPLTSNTGQFGCLHCTTSFSSKELLEKHEILHSPNAQVSCKICNKSFANVYRLQRHMISHDESAVLRKFKCTECDKAFKFKHHLKEHVRIHSGEKPFECGNCGKRFSHSGSYSSHMTSKKCLIINLKLGKARSSSNNNILEKNFQHNKTPKRLGVSCSNNMTPNSNSNTYLPMPPKYPEPETIQFLHSPVDTSPVGTPLFLTSPSLLNTAQPFSRYPSIPSLGHIIEQLRYQQQQREQCSSPLRTFAIEHASDIKQERNQNEYENMSENRENNDDSNRSVCGDLIIDDDEDMDKKTEYNQKTDSPNRNAGDLEAVKRILETVNATVTKELLTNNMQKAFSDSRNEDSRTVASNHSPRQTSCCICKKMFDSTSQLDDHECEDVRSEGLAAKLECVLTSKSGEKSNSGASGYDEQDEKVIYDPNEETDPESNTNENSPDDDKKIRVRSLIADHQLRILKNSYKLNPRPKREDLEKIANKIGFPVRVVQVWFQNTRARDRREGKLIQVPLFSVPGTTVPIFSHSSSSAQLSNSYDENSEQPLDLSIKRESFSNESSPSSSPQRPSSTNHYMESKYEITNINNKNPVSPSQYLPYKNHYQNSNSMDFPDSPTPMDFNTNKLAQIFTQPPYNFGLGGSVPMDKLMQLSLDIPGLSLLNANRIYQTSAVKKEPSDGIREMSNEITEDDLSNKISSFFLKGSSNPILNTQEQEVEGQFCCNQCDKTFSKQSSLARHKYEHSGQRPHKCDECPKAFKHKHHLTEHKRLHSGEKPFQCSKCLKRFSHSGSYSQHMNHRYSYCKPYRE